MRDAWEAGTVLAGLSAGAMCWFRGGMTMSGGAPAAVAGLGLLARQPVGAPATPSPYGCPYSATPSPRAAWSRATRLTTAPALVFAGTRLQRCVASAPGPRVLRVAPGR